MKCYIDHKNYNQFEKVYGDDGVNYIHSIFNTIPTIEEVATLPINIKKNLSMYRNSKLKNEIFDEMKEIFGDTIKEEDIEFVSSLGNKVAQFKKDGRLIFDSILIQSHRGAEYHEAFHRVFRMYMNSEEREELYKAVREKNPNKPWEIYDRATEEEKIEELLADDFMTYAVNKKFSDRSIIGKFFYRLYKLLTSIFSRPDNLEKVYDKILEGKFTLSDDKILDDANMFTFNTNLDGDEGYNVTDYEKELIRKELLDSFVNALFSTNNPYIYLEDSSLLNELIDKTKNDFLNKTNIHTSTRRLIINNIDISASGFRKELIKILKTHGVNITNKKEEDEEDNDEATPDQVEITGNVQSFNDSFSPAYEKDPKLGVSALLKLKLSTIKKGEKKSLEIDGKRSELETYYDFTEVYNYISKILTISPPDINAMKLLLSLEDKNKHITDGVINFLEELSENKRFITQFVSTFAKTNNNFGRGIVSTYGMKYKDLTFASNANVLTSALLNAITQAYNDKNSRLTKDNINSFLPEIVTINTKTEELSKAEAKLKASIIGDDNSYFENITIEEYLAILKSTQEGTHIEDFVSVSADRLKTLIKIRDRYESYVKQINRYSTLDETMHLTIDGKPIYEISLDTTTSKTVKLFNFIRKVSKPLSEGYNISYDDLMEQLKTYNELSFEEQKIYLEYEDNARFVLFAKYLPHLLNTHTMFEDNNKIKFDSVIIERLLESNLEISLNIEDGILETISPSREAKSITTLSPMEYFVYFISNLYNNIYPSVKHSDRSTFFNFTFRENDNIVNLFRNLDKSQSADSIFTSAAKHIANLLLTSEKRYYEATKKSILKNQAKYFVTPKGKPLTMHNAFQGMISDVEQLKRYFDNEIEKSEIEEQVIEDIKKWLNNTTFSKKGVTGKLITSGILKDSVFENGLLKSFKINDLLLKAEDDDKYTSLIPDLTSNRASDPANFKNILAYAHASTILFHLEEQFFLYGHFGQYATADNVYKRMNTHSGTGRTFDMSEDINEQVNDRSPFAIYNPITNEIEALLYNKGTEDPIITTLTLNEFEDYKVNDIDKRLEEYDKGLDTLRNIMKQDGFSDAQIKIRTEQMKEIYKSKYESMNMPDGQSWGNMFLIKEYKQRLGEWTDNMEYLFNLELEILQLNPYDKDVKNQAYNILRNGFKELAYINNISIEEVIEIYLESLEVLKPQYGGPTNEAHDFSQMELGDRLYNYYIMKSSIMPLLPSVTIGTNIHKLNYTMLSKGIDIVPMQSAAKTGAIDYKLLGKRILEDIEEGINSQEGLEEIVNKYNLDDVSEIDKLKEIANILKEEGLETYTKEGEYNPIIDEVAKYAKMFGYWEYYKDQVKIHNHPKEEIRNASQGMKNILTNTFYFFNDYKVDSPLRKRMPVDMLDKMSIEQWDKLSEEEKNKQSKLYESVNNYIRLLNEIIDDKRNELLEELQYEDNQIKEFKKFKELLIRSAEDRNSPENIIEALELFADSKDKIIDSLSNKNKIEPIIHSLISKIITFKRPGNAVPMVTSKLFEPIGSKKKSREEVHEYLSSYNLKDSASPAEVILPLPRTWFKKVISAVKNQGHDVDNIFDALPIFNKMLESGEREIILKGLRIPNQQFSSSDVLKVKYFNFPTVESYVIIYPEVTIKTGGDVM